MTRRIRSALSLFWSWLFSSWQVTTSPVGLWVIRTAESVVLTDCPPGPLDRNTSISRSFGSIVDVDLFGLGEHRHRGRARVDAALALGDRHPLHPVDARLVLQPGPRVVALDHERDLAVAAHVGRLARRAISTFHRVRGGRRRRTCGSRSPAQRLASSPPSAPADLDDHVLAVVGIARHEQLAQLGVERGDAPSPSRRSRCGGTHASRRRISPLEHLLRVVEILLGGLVRAVRLDDRLQLGVAASGVARGCLVARRVDVGQADFELVELAAPARRGVRTWPTRVPARSGEDRLRGGSRRRGSVRGRRRASHQRGRVHRRKSTVNGRLPRESRVVERRRLAVATALHLRPDDEVRVGSAVVGAAAVLLGPPSELRHASRRSRRRRRPRPSTVGEEAVEPGVEVGHAAPGGAAA